MTPKVRHRLINTLSPDEVEVFTHEWAFWARDGQWPPDEPWRVWVLMAGRGYGKTRAGAEWIRLNVNAHPGCKVAVVGETMDDVRNVMIEGNSGILTISAAHDRPKYWPSRRMLEWPNGSIGFCFSAHDPEQLRGPEHHYAWCDEVAKWKSGAASKTRGRRRNVPLPSRNHGHHWRGTPLDMLQPGPHDGAPQPKSAPSCHVW